MADKNFKVKNGLDIGDNVATYVTKVTISTLDTTLDSILTGTVKSADYSLTLYQGDGVIGKKILVTENGAGASTQEYGSVSVNRSEHTGVWNWTTRTFNNAGYQVEALTYGNNLWVGGDVNGQLRTSTDAITWTTRTSNFGTTQIRSVAYGNSLWVAGGGYGGGIRTENPAERQLKLVATVNNAMVAGSEATVILKKETVVA